MIGSDSAATPILHRAIVESLNGTVAAMIGENTELGTDITIRRGSTTLDPQPVRIVNQRSNPRVLESNGAEQSNTDVIVMGDFDLDIANGDRFNFESRLYEVTAVRSNIQIYKAATARLVN